MTAATLEEPTAERPAIDGRTAIRDRNRRAVLDSMVELFAEGNLDPSPEEVAPRVGLSVRSVYRYFEDGDGLVRAAIERHLELVRPLCRIPDIGEGELDERIRRFAGVRVRLYERTASTARAARLRAQYDPVVRDQIQLSRQALRDQTEHHFRSELAAMDRRQARARLMATDSLSTWDSLEHLRVNCGCSGREMRAMLYDSISALLHI